MKKTLSLIISLTLILILCFSCSNRTNIPREEEEIGDNREEELKLPYEKLDPSTWIEDESPYKEVGNESGKLIDISWYVENWEKNTFEISDEADLRGLAWLVNNNKENFYRKKITLMSDIVATQEKPWIPIGEGSRTIPGKNIEVETPSVTPNISNSVEIDDLSEIGGNDDGYEDDAKVIYRFSGIFDGNNHTISGLKNKVELDDGTIEYYRPNPTRVKENQYSYGLFGLVRGGKIKNLTLKDINFIFDNSCTYDIPTKEENNYFCRSLGSIIGQTRYGFELDNCNVINSTLSIRYDDTDTTKKNTTYISEDGSEKSLALNDIVTGGLVGRSGGQFTNETQELSPKIVIKNSSTNVRIMGGYYSGGFIGQALNAEYAEFTNLTFTGKILFPEDEANSFDITNSTARANFYSKINYAGGIAGQINQIKIVEVNNCSINNAILSSKNRVAGLVGLAYNYDTLSFNGNNINAKIATYAGEVEYTPEENEENEENGEETASYKLDSGDISSGVLALTSLGNNLKINNTKIKGTIYSGWDTGSVLGNAGTIKNIEVKNTELDARVIGFYPAGVIGYYGIYTDPDEDVLNNGIFFTIDNFKFLNNADIIRLAGTLSIDKSGKTVLLRKDTWKSFIICNTRVTGNHLITVNISNVSGGENIYKKIPQDQAPSISALTNGIIKYTLDNTHKYIAWLRLNENEAPTYVMPESPRYIVNIKNSVGVDDLTVYNYGGVKEENEYGFKYVPSEDSETSS